MKRYLQITAIFKSIIITAAAVVLMAVSMTARAQKSISGAESDKIKEDAQYKLKMYMTCINNLSDESNTPDDKTGFINANTSGTQKIFISKAMIEDDLDPNVHSSQSDPLELNTYLGNVVSFFKRTDTITYHVFETSCVKAEKGRIFVKLYFTEKFSGEYASSSHVPYTVNSRVAEMVAIQEGREWKTYISNISFYDVSKAESKTTNCIPISDQQSNVTFTEEQKPESYYAYMLQRGEVNAAQGDYDKAYYAFREAKNSQKYADEANKKIDALYVTIKKSGVLQADDYLYNKMVVKAKQQEIIHKYESALTHYRYALELNPNASNLTFKVQDLKDNTDRQRKLADMYTKGLYEQATTEYTSAIIADNENSDLYVGRAKCYAKLGNEGQAQNDFAQALKYNPANVDAYRWQGRFYYELKKIPDYDKGYTSLAAATSIMEDKKSPDAIALLSEMAFCKGLSCFKNNNFQGGIDSFAAAINLNPAYADAYCYQGRCYYGLKDAKSTEKAIALLKESIKINEKYPDAHYWLGKILYSYHRNNMDDHTDEAIVEMKIAAGYDERNGEWNFDLGTYLQTKGKSKGKDAYQDAIKYFTNCITYDSLKKSIALWRRGECYFALGDDGKASADLEKIKPKIGSNPLFNKDMGFLYIRGGKYPEALACFKNANASVDAEASFGYAKALYMSAPNAVPKEYLSWFEKAFSKGIPHDIVDNDVLVQQMSNNDRDLRDLRKKYGYK